MTQREHVEVISTPIAEGVAEAGESVIDMSLACPWVPPDGEDGRRLAKTLEEIVGSADMDDLLRYEPNSSPYRHRVVAAEWIRSMGHDVGPENVVVTSGAQHAMTVLLSTLFRPGDTILTADLTYPGFKSVAQMLPKWPPVATVAAVCPRCTSMISTSAAVMISTPWIAPESSTPFSTPEPCASCLSWTRCGRSILPRIRLRP